MYFGIIFLQNAISYDTVLSYKKKDLVRESLINA